MVVKNTVILPNTMDPLVFARAVLTAVTNAKVAIPVPPGMTEERAMSFREHAAKSERAGVLFATSGTIGDSKLVIRSGESLAEEAEGVISALRLNKRSRVLITSPMTHSYGFGMLMACALAECEVQVIEGDNVFGRILQTRRTLLEKRFDVVTGVPFMFRQLLRGPVRLHFDTVSYAGGEPVPSQLIWQWVEKTGAPLCQEYGLSEVGIVSFSRPEDPFTSIGRPVPGCTVQQDFGFSGELVVHRKGNPTSYLLGDSGETFVRDGVHTGDLGFSDEDGRWYLIGRRKSVIYVGGNNVVPEEVETAIRSISGVEDVVVAEYTRKSGETGVRAYIAPQLSAEELAEVRDHLVQNLWQHAVPSSFVTMRELPRTPSGKVDRNALV